MFFLKVSKQGVYILSHRESGERSLKRGDGIVNLTMAPHHRSATTAKSSVVPFSAWP